MVHSNDSLSLEVRQADSWPSSASLAHLVSSKPMRALFSKSRSVLTLIRKASCCRCSRQTGRHTCACVFLFSPLLSPSSPFSPFPSPFVSPSPSLFSLIFLPWCARAPSSSLLILGQVAERHLFICFLFVCFLALATLNLPPSWLLPEFQISSSASCKMAEDLVTCECCLFSRKALWSSSCHKEPTFSLILSISDSLEIDSW